MDYLFNIVKPILRIKKSVNKVILNCVVVDDSSDQRLSIVRLINSHPSLNLVAEYSNTIEAKIGLINSKVDLVFLDIEMPILNGFELLDELAVKPKIIFIANKTKYAFKAFEYDAVDYLKKPFLKERFFSAVHKAITIFKLKKADGFNNQNFIFVKSNLKKRKVFIDELKYVEALGDYIKVVTYHESLLVLSTMKSIAALLPQNRFLRIHKSYIINLEKVERYNSKAVEIENEFLPLSRNKKTELKKALSSNFD